MRRLLGVLVALLALAAVVPNGAQAAGVPYLGLSAMGMPSAPLPWMPTDFAVTKHFRQSSGALGYGPPADSGNEPMLADHGADCSAPPATHQQGTDYASLAFICHDHLMTAINSGAYGQVQFQPAQLVDFSSGPATVSISVSTLARADRDWLDWFFVPFNEQLALTTDDNDPENIKLPRDSVQVLEHNYEFTFTKAFETVNGNQTQIPTNWWQNVTDYTPASAVTRTPITFVISRTHLTVSAAGHTFIDTAFPVPLPFTQAVFQSAHHSYDVTKDGGTPNTWHWSDLSISNAVPYYLGMGMPDAAGTYSWLTTRTTFAPAPSGAHLRFQWFNGNYDLHSEGFVSFDNGATWAVLNEQALTQTPTGGVSAINIWQAVPAGATSAMFRGPAGWYARDFYVMAPAGAVAPTPTASATATPTPSAIATPTTAPTRTPQPTSTPVPPTATPVATATPVCVP